VKPSPWAEAFTIPFISNISWSGNQTIGSAPDAVTGTLLYDWSQRSQRTDHAAGAVECVKFYATRGPCSTIMTEKGMYRILHDPLPSPSTPRCCLDMPSIHANPPGWAAAGSVDAGASKLPHGSAPCHEWHYPGAGHGGECGTRNTSDSGCHIYMAAVVDGTVPGKVPILFTFPAAEGRQDQYYDTAKIQYGPVDPSAFALPAGCASTRCDAAPPS